MRVLIDLIVLVIEIIVLIGGVTTLIHSLHIQREISNEEAAASQQSDREAAQRKLLNIMENHHKQPQLWWGDECVTISEDGSRVVHIPKPQPRSAKVRTFDSEKEEWKYADVLFMRYKTIGGNGFLGSCTAGGSGHSGSGGSEICVRGGYGNKIIGEFPNPWGTVETN